MLITHPLSRASLQAYSTQQLHAYLYATRAALIWFRNFYTSAHTLTTTDPIIWTLSGRKTTVEKIFHEGSRLGRASCMIQATIVTSRWV